MKQDPVFHRFFPIDHHYKKAFETLKTVQVEVVVAVVIMVDLNDDVSVHPSEKHSIRQYQVVDRVLFELHLSLHHKQSMESIKKKIQLKKRENSVTKTFSAAVKL
jgi:hypothetical protein